MWGRRMWAVDEGEIPFHQCRFPHTARNLFSTHLLLTCIHPYLFTSIFLLTSSLLLTLSSSVISSLRTFHFSPLFSKHTVSSPLMLLPPASFITFPLLYQQYPITSTALLSLALLVSFPIPLHTRCSPARSPLAKLFCLWLPCVPLCLVSVIQVDPRRNYVSIFCVCFTFVFRGLQLLSRFSKFSNLLESYSVIYHISVEYYLNNMNTPCGICNQFCWYFE